MNSKMKLDCYKSMIEVMKNSGDYNLVKTLTYFFNEYKDYFNLAKIVIENNSELINQKIEIDIFDECEKKYYDILINDDENLSLTIHIYAKIKSKIDKEEKEFIDDIIRSFVFRFNFEKCLELLKNVKYKDQLTHFSNIQGLTLFFNKHYNYEELKKYAVLCVDIQKFKDINEKYSEHFGNIVLKMIANLIKKNISDDEIVYRQSVDNFIIIIKKEKLGMILKALSNFDLNIQGIEIKIKTKIGYSILTDELQLNEMIENAKLALQLAKLSKNIDVIEYTDELKNKFIEYQKITQELKEAIKKCELINYYQPKYDSRSNTIIGVEALVRWDKNGKILTPAAFIDILEEIGLIKELDFVVLERVCKDINECKKNGLIPQKTSVNFSMKHVENSNEIDRIISTLEKYNIDPSLIEIELTELTSANSIEQLKSFIERLHKNNIKISMDDFGSGYSSLHLLKELDYDVIKIDKSLIDNIEKNNSKNIIILEYLINMLNNLEIEIIAEGVETKEQLDILNSFNCFNIQGYYFDKPLNFEEYKKRLVKKI